MTSPLTPQQTRILHLYTQGHNERTIAEHLYLGIETIRTHTKHIRQRLDAHTIAQAVAKAYEQGLLP